MSNVPTAAHDDLLADGQFEGRLTAPQGARPPQIAAGTVVVFDTSTLLHDPEALTAFGGTDVVVPLTVLKELNGKKGAPGDVGANARRVLRTLEGLRHTPQTTLAEPTPLGEGVTVRVERNHVNYDAIGQAGLDASQNDWRIVGAALGQQAAGRQVMFVSNDLAQRLVAAHLGVPTCEYVPPQAQADEPTGWTVVAASDADVDAIYAGQFPRQVVDAVDYGDFAIVEGSAGHTALVRRLADGTCRRVRDRVDVAGLSARNVEQTFALDLLTDADVPLVALEGPAGSGKTLLAAAAGLAALERGDVDQLLMLRPVVAVDKQDVGYLPGNLTEKMSEHAKVMVDALQVIKRCNRQQATRELQQLVDKGKVEVGPITFLRGRSLKDLWVIVDETQNLSPSAVKTILTRIGEGTKVVLTGDPSQIDVPYLSSRNCGLTVAIGAFAAHDTFGHVRMTRCQRSALADAATRLL